MKKSNIITRALAAFVAAAVTLNICAYAETTDVVTVPNETTIISTDSTKPETGIVDAQKPETQTTGTDDEEESHLPESGIDLSDVEYKQPDLTGYVEWDGKTKMKSGTNYYITSATKPRATVKVPKDSTLIIRSGAELVIYKDRKLNVGGKLIVEPNAKLSVSGSLASYAGSGIDIYGKIAATKSSEVQIVGEYVVRHSATAIYSNIFNLYSAGLYLNYGVSSFTSNSKLKITGELQVPKGGKLSVNGYIGITINGRATIGGNFSLTGEFVNSGVFIFEKGSRFFKTKAARFAVSKSSRLIDYRVGGTTFGGANMGSNKDVGRKGIDVSYAQGAVDWEKVRASGITFAMLRASRGAVSAAKPMAKDTTFDYNATQATKYGVKIGVYHYLYATTVEEAKEEAKFFIKTIEPYQITYPVVLDIEEEYQANLGVDKVTAIAKAFLDEVSAAGYYAMIYANKAWLTTRLDMSKLADYDVWLAQWNTVPTYAGAFGMWQYSSKGIVSGIEGYVDLNIAYKNYEKIIRDEKYNHLED